MLAALRHALRAFTNIPARAVTLPLRLLKKLLRKACPGRKKERTSGERAG